MRKGDIMNVFDCAIKIEEETKRYYQGLEAESQSPEMKHLFSMLVASEDEHHDILIRLRSIAPEQVQLAGLDGAACHFRPPLTQRELLEETENDPDLYKFTVKEEEQEISLYEELSARAGDEATAQSLRMLADAERRHLSIMENIYDFVQAPKSYLAWGEFSNLQSL